MPHKHRRLNDGDKTRFNLAPTERARPLPVGKAGQTVFTTTTEEGTTGKKRKRGGKPATATAPAPGAGYGADDTPRAFARLMQRQNGLGSERRKASSGLDEGGPKPREKNKTKAKRSDGRGGTDRKKGVGAAKSIPSTATGTTSAKDTKRDKEEDELEEEEEEQQQQQDTSSSIQPKPLKIQHGESLSDFAARVDRTMPVVGPKRKAGAAAAGIPLLKERRTKTERKLHKLYATWRAEEAAIKEKEEEAREKAEEEEEERNAELGNAATLTGDGGGRRGKQRGQRMIGESGDKEDDPWAELNKKRGKPPGLHDVAQAPPDFKRLPTEKFKVKGMNGAAVKVADVPGAAGSLKRREELSEARKEIIERYRAMMGR